MNYLSEINGEFLKDSMPFMVAHVPDSVFYPIPSTIGDLKHHQLLVNYAERWASKDKSMIVQRIDAGNLTRANNKSSLIAYVSASFCDKIDYELEFIKWDAPSVVPALSQHFNKLVLTYGIKNY